MHKIVYIGTEREGVEPSVALTTTSVFKTDALNHSATFPTTKYTSVSKKVQLILSFKCVWSSLYDLVVFVILVISLLAVSLKKFKAGNASRTRDILDGNEMLYH